MVGVNFMKKRAMKKYVPYFLLLIFLYPLLSRADGTDKQEYASNEALVAFIKQLSGQFVEGSLTVKGLEGYLSSTAEQAENKLYWSIESKNSYQLRITAEAQTKNAAISDLSIYTNDIEQLTLTNLENMFGKARVIVSSKTTWVKFDELKTKNDKDIAISAHLFFPPGNGVSPVLAVMFRID